MRRASQAGRLSGHRARLADGKVILSPSHVHARCFMKGTGNNSWLTVARMLLFVSAPE